MRTLSVRVFCILAACVSLVPSPLSSQTASDYNMGATMSADASTTPPTWRFSWWGRSGYHYLVQVSFDLQTWSYLPATNPSGEGAPITVVVPFDAGSNTSPTKIFFRAVEFDAAASPLTGNALPDSWEQFYFGTTEVNQNADPDSDGLTNLQEYRLGTNPLVADTDEDGIPDGWEYSKNLNPKSAADAALDPDKDGLTNHREFLAGANPQSKDSDGDGLADGLEVSLGSPVAEADAAAEIVFIPEFLPTPAGTFVSSANAISNSGFVVGYLQSVAGSAIRWSANGFALAGNQTLPAAVNDAGVAVGSIYPDWDGNSAMYWPVGAAPQRLGGALETFSASAVNQSGVIVGDGWSDLLGKATGYTRSADGDLRALPTPSGYFIARPYSINDENVIVGTAENYGVSRAIRWISGEASLLPSPAEIAWDVNNAGEIVGTSTSGPFVFRSGVLHLLPNLENTTPVFSDLRINLSGVVLGNSSEGSMIWQPDGQGGWSPPSRLAERLVTDLPPALFRAVGLNDQCDLVGDYNYDLGATQAVRFRPAMRPRVLVDNNRDGVIKTDTSDLTTAATPYRFWVNDDDDVDDDDPDDSENAPVSTADYTDDKIDGTRDMEDFSRLKLYLGGLQDAVLQGQIQIGLKWKETTGSPSVKVWRNLSPKGGTEYLSDVAVARQHLTLRGPGLVQGTTSYIIPTQYWQDVGLSSSQPYGNLLFEGCTAGKGQLVITLHKADGTAIGEGSGVWIDLKNIKSMYERVKATADGAENFPFPYDHVGSDSVPAPAMGWTPDPNGFPFEPALGESATYIVSIHGWNQTYERSIMYAETMFKRMWHRGYKGRFAAFRWPTFFHQGLSLPTSYNDSEYRAWKCGVSLKQYLDTLPGTYTVNIVAHSMGNIVAGSALEKGASVTNYALLNAAVPAICYDTSGNVEQTSWGYVTPNDDPDPATIALSYQGRFANVSGNLVNFFLPADSALSAWELNNDSPSGGRFPVGAKPHQWPEGSLETAGYRYQRTATAGQKLRVVRVGGERILASPDEAMGFAVQAPSLTVGADGRTRGAIDDWVDMTAYGFDSVHSAEFLFTIHQTRDFYGTLLLKLGVAVQP